MRGIPFGEPETRRKTNRNNTHRNSTERKKKRKSKNRLGDWNVQHPKTN